MVFVRYPRRSRSIAPARNPSPTYRPVNYHVPNHCQHLFAASEECLPGAFPVGFTCRDPVGDFRKILPLLIREIRAKQAQNCPTNQTGAFLEGTVPRNAPTLSQSGK